MPAITGPWCMREMFAFHASFDATEWTLGIFYDFWHFLVVKNGVFGRKWQFFSDFRVFIIVG